MQVAMAAGDASRGDPGQYATVRLLPRSIGILGKTWDYLGDGLDEPRGARVTLVANLFSAENRPPCPIFYAKFFPNTVFGPKAAKSLAARLLAFLLAIRFKISADPSAVPIPTSMATNAPNVTFCAGLCLGRSGLLSTRSVDVLTRRLIRFVDMRKFSASDIYSDARTLMNSFPAAAPVGSSGDGRQQPLCVISGNMEVVLTMPQENLAQYFPSARIAENDRPSVTTEKTIYSYLRTSMETPDVLQCPPTAAAASPGDPGHRSFVVICGVCYPMDTFQDMLDLVGNSLVPPTASDIEVAATIPAPLPAAAAAVIEISHAAGETADGAVGLALRKGSSGNDASELKCPDEGRENQDSPSPAVAEDTSSPSALPNNNGEDTPSPTSGGGSPSKRKRSADSAAPSAKRNRAVVELDHPPEASRWK